MALIWVSVVAALAVLVPNKVVSLVVVPQTTLPLRSLPVQICAPTTLPEIYVPDDFITCAREVQENRNKTNEEMNKSTPEVLELHGYFHEDHSVTTADGYILTVNRVTGGAKSPPAAGKKSVFLNHGLFGASDNWLIQYYNLVYALADDGFDVWLGNCRGTTYSQGHATLNPNTDRQYWDFTWHEMGVYDVPAVIDHIRQISGNDKVMYVGYSMGTTQYFVSLSSIPEMNDKIEVGVLLAPVAFMGHSNNVVRLISPAAWTQVQYILDPLVGPIKAFKDFQALTNISPGDLCEPIVARCGFCNNIYFLAGGFDPSQMNYTNLPNILSKVPNVASFKTLVHYAQSMNTCNFSLFDYGPENFERYGSSLPPVYDISKITPPTYMFHGARDNFALPEDVYETARHMKAETVRNVTLVNWPKFNHLDMVYGKDSYNLVFKYVQAILNGHRDSSSFVWIDDTV